MALNPGKRALAGFAAVVAGLFIGLVPAAADPGPPLAEIEPENALCLTCHDQSLIVKVGTQEERTVERVRPVAFGSSAHGETACLECHPGLSKMPHRDPGELVTANIAPPVSCSQCHDEAYEGFMAGHHGTMAKLEDARGPECADCHGSAHYLKPVEKWTEEERVEACAECHSGANGNFLDAAPGHAEASIGFLATSYFAGLFLMVLTVLTLAFGIIHVELEMLRWIAHRFTGGGKARSAGDGHTG